MSFLHENGWILFIVTEGLTWVFVALFFYSRYWLRFDRLSQYWLLLIVLINVFQILLGGIDFYYTGKISFFQIVIVLFITYASTLGSSDFQRLDKFIKAKMNPHRKYIDRLSELDTLQVHLPYRQALFIAHTIAFLLFHYVWYLLDLEEKKSSLNDFSLTITSFWFQSVDLSFFNAPIYMMISYCWSMVYLYDLFVILVYLWIWFSYKVEAISKR